MAVLNSNPESELSVGEFNLSTIPFPTHFADISNKSLEDLTGQWFEPSDLTASEEGGVEQSAAHPDDSTVRLNRMPRNWESRIFKLEPSSSRVKVVGIDTTCRRVGKTRIGFLCALRGTVVWRDDYAYRYQRYGPMLIHIDNHNESLIGNGLKNSTLMTGMEALLEREIQRQACNHFKDSIILLDGCLATHGSDPAEKAGRLVSVLNTARSNGNSVLAFAKHTRIISNEIDIPTILDNYPYSGLLYVGDLASEQFKSLKSLGHTFIAKLSPTGYNFRMDIDRELGLFAGIETVQRLMRSDVIVQGYPEVLRLAHIFSIFTSMEVLGIQRFLAARYGLRVDRPLHTRRLLFGPFGRWDGA
jgi:hypothetical protein